MVRTGFCLAPKQVDSCCWDLVSWSVYRVPKGWIILARCRFTLALCYWALFIFLLKLPLPEISVIPWALLPASACSWPPWFDKQCLLVTFKASLGVSSWPGLCLSVSHRWVEKGRSLHKSPGVVFQSQGFWSRDQSLLYCSDYTPLAFKGWIFLCVLKNEQAGEIQQFLFFLKKHSMFLIN